MGLLRRDLMPSINRSLQKDIHPANTAQSRITFHKKIKIASSMINMLSNKHSQILKFIWNNQMKILRKDPKKSLKKK